jgi:hypothetical protein
MGLLSSIGDAGTLWSMDESRVRRRRSSAARGAGRAWTSLALSALLLSGCAAPSPSPSPSPPSLQPSAGPVGPSPSSSAPPLATMLRDSIDADAIVADLDRLAAITDTHGGVRPPGGDGHAAAAGWVADELRGAGYEVTLDSLLLPLFSQDDPGALEIDDPGAPTFQGPRDFKAMVLSPSGEVTAPVYALDFDRDAQPGDRNGTGCEAASWTDVPAGAIVLAQPGRCLARTIVEHAQAAGASALVSAYPEWGPDEVRRPTLLNPSGLTIPVVAATRDVGLALADAALSGEPAHLLVSTTVSMRPSETVIGETPGGDPDHVVMVGAHLDGTIDGPGINDNGSGTAAVLEIARRLAAATGGQPTWKVRVALWTGEEVGLWGSVKYVDSLGVSERRSISAYLNFDMLGSPNGVRQVYGAAELKNPSSALLEGLFGQAFESDGLTWEAVELGASSDDYRFNQQDVPVGGLFSGATQPKTDAQATAFGGSAGAPYDACYHLACDTVDNVDPILLEQMTRAAGWVVGYLASGAVDLSR